jgi:hypothetical protein
MSLSGTLGSMPPPSLGSMPPPSTGCYAIPMLRFELSSFAYEGHAPLQGACGILIIESPKGSKMSTCSLSHQLGGC